MTPQPNPCIAEQLNLAKQQLESLKAEKARLYPPNPHPFVQPDRYPQDYTPDQVRFRNELVKRIEDLEKRIQDLEDQLYT
ncbi:MAG: hypothetical protein M1570_14960 [Chloroflexi bacterium]|nr:hypothetical protein [Chloroflexota bacterium]